MEALIQVFGWNNRSWEAQVLNDLHSNWLQISGWTPRAVSVSWLILRMVTFRYFASIHVAAVVWLEVQEIVEASLSLTRATA